MVSVFSHDHDIRHILKSGKLSVWYLLSFSQPLNAALFVYDGLLYAAQVLILAVPLRSNAFYYYASVSENSTFSFCAHAVAIDNTHSRKQAFFFVRNLMLSGFFLVFLPLLAYAAYWKKSLSSVWIATAALNIWRTGGNQS